MFGNNFETDDYFGQCLAITEQGTVFSASQDRSLRCICDDDDYLMMGDDSNFEDNDNSDECKQVLGRCEGGRSRSDNGSRRLCAGKITDVHCTGS